MSVDQYLRKLTLKIPKGPSEAVNRRTTIPLLGTIQCLHNCYIKR